MSEMVFKLAIRGHIPELDGQSRNDVFSVFREKFGEPDELDEYDGVVNWFSYDNSDQNIVPVSSLDGKWGLECIFKDDSGNMDFCISRKFLDNTLMDMQSLFPSIQDIIIHAYSWYTGVDEPITFSTNI